MGHRVSLANLTWLVGGLFLGVVIDSTFFQPAVRQSVPSRTSVTPGTDPNILVSASPQPMIELPPDRPIISVEQPVYQFGEVEAGGKVDHEFVIQNAGKSLLIIAGVRPTCGCTIAMISSQELQPGESATLKVELSLQKLRGPVNKGIIIQSNDPVDSSFRLSLVGDATSRVTVTPETIACGQVRANTAVVKTATIDILKDLSLQLKGLTTSSERINASFETLSEGKQYRLNVVFNATGNSGSEQGWIHLHTDHDGEYQTIVVPVSAYVTGGRNPDFKPVAP